MNSHRHDVQSHVVRLALFCCVLFACVGAARGGQSAHSSNLVDAQPAAAYLAGLGAGAENSLSGTRQAAAQADLSGLVGGQLYIGQGLDENVLPAGTASALRYVVVAGGNRPQAGEAARSASPAYADLLMSSHNRLLQGTTPALGTLSEADMSMVFLPEPPVYDDSSYTVTITRKQGRERSLAYEAQTFEQVLAANVAAIGQMACPATRDVSPVAATRNTPRKPPVTLALAPMRDPQVSAKSPARGLRLATTPVLPSPAYTYTVARSGRAGQLHYAIYVAPARSSAQVGRMR